METFLAACLLTTEDFAELPLQQRAELVALYRRSCSTNPITENFAELPLQQRAEPVALYRRSCTKLTTEDFAELPLQQRAEQVALYRRSSTEDFAELPLQQRDELFAVGASVPMNYAEKYIRLVEHCKYQECIETTEVLKFKRNRVAFPMRALPRNLPQKCLQISDESALWLRRLYHWHEDEKQEKDNKQENKQEHEETDGQEELWSVQDVFERILSLENVKRLDSYIQREKVNLSASTFLKGYTSILSAIKVICGGNLSGAETPQLLAIVTQVKNYVHDLISEYHAPASLATNSAEKQRLLFSMNASVSATEKLKRVYFVLITESFWFLHNFGGGTTSTSDMLRGMGFAVFATVMARPASRKNIITQLKLSDVPDQKENYEFSVVFEKHKTGRTSHCLVTIFPPWLAKVLQMYVKHIRPLLSSIWVGPPTLLFPDTAFGAFGKFLSSLGMVVNASGIRQLFCQSVGELTVESAYFTQRGDLQTTAGHLTPRGRTIEAHYELTAKPDRERLLQRYIQETFCAPMELVVKEILEMQQPDVRTPRKQYPRSCQKNELLAFSSESEENEEEQEASEYTTDNDDSPAELPIPQFRSPTKKRRRGTQDNIQEQKRAKRTVEMTAELKLEVKRTLQESFRLNYLLGDEVVVPLLNKTLAGFFGDDADTPAGQVVMTELRKYAKGLLKNWTNVLPCKYFTTVALAQALTTVGQLKQLMNTADVTRLLKKHPCYGDIIVADEQLKRLRKDVEQRVANFRAHMELGEVAGPTPDSKRHWSSLLSWRRSGFLCTRFEQIALEEIDGTVLLERDYMLPGEH
jgi:hypothetical protein